MKKAVKSFLGVKKRKNNYAIDNRDAPVNYNTNLKKSRSKYGSMNFLNEPEPRRERQKLAPKRSHSFTGVRTSSLPQSTRERVEEWNRNATLEFDDTPSWANEEFLSDPETNEHVSRRTQSLHHRKHSMRNSNSIDRRANRYPSKRELAQWKYDYEEQKSHQQQTSRRQSFRDSGAFDLYVNDRVNSPVMPDDSTLMGRTVSKSSTIPQRKQPSRLGSRSLTRLSSSATSQPRGRTVSHASQASDKLFSCMNALERLTLKLENADQISTEVEQFREASKKIASIDAAPKEEPFYSEPAAGGKCNWEIGNERIPRHNSVITEEDFRGGRHKSEDNSSTDSGVNINEYENKGPTNNPPSRPRKNQRYPELDYKNPQRYQQEQKFQVQQKYQQEQQQPQTWYPHPNRYPQHLQQQRHLRSDSMSSGYSSGSGGNPTPPLQQHYAQHNSQLAMNNSPAMQNDPRYAMQGYQSQGYDYNQGYDPNYGNDGGYVEEDPYGHGTYGGYASSSIYDEDIHQQNGWFYLPTAHQQAYPQAAAQQQYQQQQYPPQHQSYAHNQYPYTQTTRYPYGDQSAQMWTGEKYGGLSDSFHDPASGITPLAAAISSQCADQTDLESEISSVDWKKYGSFRSKNGERTFMNANDIAASRRKTVRFNQTVKQRVMENEESEMEDSTSVIKGCTGEEVYDSPKSAHQPSTTACQHSLSEHPIYEFPSGHIESSCMCSDCILARSSSQVKPASSYVYY